MNFDSNYETMFGQSNLPHFHPMTLPMFPVFLNPGRIEKTMELARRSGKWVLAFCIGTKPCYYKFFGSVQAAEQADLPYFVIDAGQHYDELLTHGKDEFNLRDRVACELGIRGDLALKSAELMVKIRITLEDAYWHV